MSTDPGSTHDAPIASVSPVDNVNVASSRRAALFQLLQLVHPTGSVIEIIGNETEDGLRPLTFESIRQFLNESATGGVNVPGPNGELLDDAPMEMTWRCIALDRCGLQEVLSTSHGCPVATVSLLTEPIFIQQWRESLARFKQLQKAAAAATVNALTASAPSQIEATPQDEKTTTPSPPFDEREYLLARDEMAALNEIVVQATQCYERVTELAKLLSDTTSSRLALGGSPKVSSLPSPASSTSVSGSGASSSPSSTSDAISRRILPTFVYDLTRPSSIADHALAFLASFRTMDLQQLALAESDVFERLKTATKLLREEIDVLRAQHSIRSKLKMTQSEVGLTLELLERQKERILQAQTQLEHKSAPPSPPSPPSVGETKTTDSKEKEKEKDPSANTTADESAKTQSADKSAGTEAPINHGPPKSSKQMAVDKFEARLATKTLPAHVREVWDEEVSKYLATDSDQSTLAHLSRHYLDWLSSLPWGVYSTDHLDLRRAESILNGEHHGMKAVKEQILELIAMGQMRQVKDKANVTDANDSSADAADAATTTTKKSSLATSALGGGGKIICLLGPPGVGQ